MLAPGHKTIEDRRGQTEIWIRSKRRRPRPSIRTAWEHLQRGTLLTRGEAPSPAPASPNGVDLLHEWAGVAQGLAESHKESGE
jgi:hypothetical protein